MVKCYFTLALAILQTGSQHSNEMKDWNSCPTELKKPWPSHICPMPQEHFVLLTLSLQVYCGINHEVLATSAFSPHYRDPCLSIKPYIGEILSSIIHQSIIKVYSCAQNCSTPLAFPYDFYRNKSRNIDYCVNSMLPINQNKIVSQGLELILSMFRRTTMSGQHTLI